MMTTVDEQCIQAPADLCIRIAADVECWPRILAHYRRVRFRERYGFGFGRVEMAAYRPFGGRLRYPVWWVSDMRTELDEPAVYYRHVAGITRGMDVKWAFLPEHDGTTRVRITHAWTGPDWPLIGRLAWVHVIGPYFVSAIARRTLAGVAAEAERRVRDARATEPGTAGKPITLTDARHD